MEKFCQMLEFFNVCKLCPLVLLSFGIFFFLLGYFLNAEVIRILWLLESGLIILLSIFCFVRMFFSRYKIK